jgi:hypothetical protein
MRRRLIEEMKHLLVVCLILTSLISQGQDKVRIKTCFKPNKVYKTTFSTSSQWNINFTGSQEKIKNIKAKGTALPRHISSSNEMSIIERTGEYTNDGNIPVSITYGKVITKKKLNDKETNEEESYSNLVIKGFYNKKNQLKIDSVISDKLNNVAQVTLRSIAESLQQKIKFPKHSLGIGDTFDHELPIQVPLDGLDPVNIILNIHYELVEIRDGKAIFNVVQTVASGVSSSAVENTLVTGKGTGISEYDIADNVITKYDSNLQMTLKILTDGLLVSATIDAQSNQLMSVEHNNLSATARQQSTSQSFKP